MEIGRFKKLPILGILRGIDQDRLEPLIETIIASGLETIEITMNTPNAPLLIKKSIEIAGKKLAVGAGTVLDKQALEAAVLAGATFIVMPVLVEEVARYCTRNKIPFFPGALSPQEIYTAWHSGATMVKVFPSGFFGPQYFKEIKGPFGDIELLACGGVTAQNMREYLAGGASAVAFGASVFKPEWLRKKDFSSIAASVRDFVTEGKSIFT
ncbi:MAG: bifunctional 4-hydroxy-2-oxoglutarate aldolase/2-dehydro-3-deoxy-phosphogluconate aldolase [Candidatus Omnitrophica bacterium]|nr:bifunctional 4-hydroxy-2-oxoglutarate aldolase/2-dehydro-3-deoxy-phosphogluconate aldolase [Candidatus Omnitrophota bacterium]